MWPVNAVSKEYCTFSDQEELEPTPVLHGFGRGQFRERAEKVRIPDVLLNELCNRTSWSMSTTWGTRMGGAVRSTPDEPRPRRGGRAKALKLRSEQLRQEQSSKPGRKNKGPPQTLRMPSATNPRSPTVSVYYPTPSELEHCHEWPALKPGGLSEDNSSDVLTDEFSSDLSTNSMPPSVAHGSASVCPEGREGQSGYASDPVISRGNRPIQAYPKERHPARDPSVHPVHRSRKIADSSQSAVDGTGS